MKHQHTPGPWSIGEIRHAGRTQLVLADANPRGYVCEVDAFIVGDALNESEREANARLIAAAPELLDAADKLIGDYDPESDDPRYDALRAAIAKATGR